MRIMVRPRINKLPDRVLLVQEARKRALAEPGMSIFVRNGVEYFHATSGDGELYIGGYMDRCKSFEPFNPA